MRLAIHGLEVSIGIGAQPTHVLRGVDLELAPGQVTGLVGETGSGKSMTVLSAAGLLPKTARVTAGSVQLDGRELVGLSELEWQRIRGRDIALILQNARAALHPLIPIGKQVARLHRHHMGSGAAEAMDAAEELLAQLGMLERRLLDAFAHELSGGQCQRVMNAMALICRPSIILADEPTAGLDATVERKVLGALLHRVRESGTTMLVVSHDVGVIRDTCDHIAVMYAGQVVEVGPRDTVLEHPAHPYTRALLACASTDQERMPFIEGAVADLRKPVIGCAFSERCPEVFDDCRIESPEALSIGTATHSVRCLLHQVETNSHAD